MRQLVAAALLTICLASLAPGAASAPGASPLASNEPFTFTLRPSRIIVRIPDTSGCGPERKAELFQGGRA